MLVTRTSVCGLVTSHSTGCSLQHGLLQLLSRTGVGEPGEATHQRFPSPTPPLPLPATGRKHVNGVGNC